MADIIPSQKPYCKELIIGFILLFLFFIPFASIIGYALCVHAFFRIRRSDSMRGRKLAKSAMWIGGVFLVLNIIAIYASYLFFSIRVLGFEPARWKIGSEILESEKRLVIHHHPTMDPFTRGPDHFPLNYDGSITNQIIPFGIYNDLAENMRFRVVPRCPPALNAGRELPVDFTLLTAKDDAIKSKDWSFEMLRVTIGPDADTGKYTCILMVCTASYCDFKPSPDQDISSKGVLEPPIPGIYTMDTFTLELR